MSNPIKALVVIPTYNELENLGRLIPEILAADKCLHILIVDDGSPDGTAAAMTNLSQCGCAVKRLFLESRPGKLGLGSAYVHGLNWGLKQGYDFMIQMDADWSHNPRYLARMLQLGAETDFVVGSRYVPGGGTINWGFGRRFLSRFASFYSRRILGVDFADFTGGFNGWSRRVLLAIGLDTIQSDGYSFQIELKYRADQLGYSHIEFPILFSERRAGKSKMSTAIALEACWRVWEFRNGRKAVAQQMA
jgi:dolichol-phosphate mannosyltransferase